MTTDSDSRWKRGIRFCDSRNSNQWKLDSGICDSGNYNLCSRIHRSRDSRNLHRCQSGIPNLSQMNQIHVKTESDSVIPGIIIPLNAGIKFSDSAFTDLWFRFHIFWFRNHRFWFCFQQILIPLKAESDSDESFHQNLWFRFHRSLIPAFTDLWFRFHRSLIPQCTICESWIRMLCKQILIPLSIDSDSRICHSGFRFCESRIQILIPADSQISESRYHRSLIPAFTDLWFPLSQISDSWITDLWFRLHRIQNAAFSRIQIPLASRTLNPVFTDSDSVIAGIRFCDSGNSQIQWFRESQISDSRFHRF